MGAVGGFRYLDNYYKKHAIKIVHASDIDSKAIETYNSNQMLFGHQAQVADVTTLNFSKNDADIVIGGFPCQNFSSVNPSKEPEKKENQLFWELARVVEEVSPKVFVGENVKGFYSLHQGKYFHLAKEKFEKLGYKVFWSIINMSHYGIPQLRERLFMVGIRKDLQKKNFLFPQTTHGDELFNKPLVPLKAVIDSLIPEDEKYYFSARAVEGVKKAKNNMKRALAQDLDKPCLTITSHLAKVSLNSRDPVLLVNESRELYRRFTPREAARIQSFPDNFVFPGSDGVTYKQIGNAISPVFFWHLMDSIIKYLDSNGQDK